VCRVGEFGRGQWRGEVRANGGQSRLDGGRRLSTRYVGSRESVQCGSCSGEVDVWREEHNGRLRPAKVK
jgi:hypothetical protein